MKHGGLFLILLAFITTVQANDKRWNTRVEINTNHSAILNWVQVYEGNETVEKITVLKGKKILKKYTVFGQPVFNDKNNYVALPYCADDGCEKTIEIINLTNSKKPFTIKLPIKQQMHIEKCEWKGNSKLSIHISYLGKPSMEQFYEFNAEEKVLKLLSERIYDKYRRD